MAEKPVTFAALERAFWRHVDQSCPHPLHSRHRYTWLRANKVFPFQGTVWERTSLSRSTEVGSVAPGTHLIIYSAPDGTIIQDWLATGPIFRAA